MVVSTGRQGISVACTQVPTSKVCDRSRGDWSAADFISSEIILLAPTAALH